MFCRVKIIVLNNVDAACLENREQSSDLARLSVTPFRLINLSPVRYISNRGMVRGVILSTLIAPLTGYFDARLTQTIRHEH
jgi:hypothetical protein